MEDLFSRTELLIGKNALKKIRKSKVAVFGIGGVGSFTVEALARCGIGKIILIDNDSISLSNINRQIHANFKTLNKSKVEVMRNRILNINPNCEVIINNVFAKEDNIEKLIEEDIDYVIDAIDTVTSKISIILWCKNHNKNIISCMGTGNKLDPTKFKIADIYDTKICPLARVMRRELRKRNVDSLKVLYSEEIPIKNTILSGSDATKKVVPGSISFVPSVAGLIIAGEVIKDLISKV